MVTAAAIVVTLAVAALVCIGLGGYLHFKYGSKVQKAGELVAEELKK